MKRFVLDNMLGKLAKILRVLGYDAEYLKEGFSNITVVDGETLYLTKRRAFAKKKGFVVLTENNPYRQLVELLKKGLVSWDDKRAFTRCIECNSPLKEVSREDVFGLVPDFVYATHSKFALCPSCGRVYWDGTHTDNMRKRLKELLHG